MVDRCYFTTATENSVRGLSSLQHPNKLEIPFPMDGDVTEFLALKKFTQITL